MFWRTLVKALTKWGQCMNDEYDRQHDTYKPNYDGQWVNKGSRYNENWVWEEKVKDLRPVYVNIFKIEDDYIIAPGYRPRDNTIDTIQCDNMSMAIDMVDAMEAYYSVFGNVIAHRDMQE